MTSLIQNRSIYSVLSCDYYMICHVTIISFVMWLLYDLSCDYYIARLKNKDNYKDFYIALLHEILRLKYFLLLSAHDNCNHPLYLHLNVVCMNFAIISQCLYFLFGKTSMPYYILLFSFAKVLGNSNIVNNMFKLAMFK